MVLLARITRQNRACDDCESGDRRFWQQCSRHEGAAALDDFFRVPDLYFQGENPRSALYWLCMVMILVEGIM